MGTPTQGQRPHQSFHFQAWLNLALTQTLRHDTLGKTMPAQMQILFENKRGSNFHQFLELKIFKSIKECGLSPHFASA